MDFSKYENKFRYFSRRENPEGYSNYCNEEARIEKMFQADLFQEHCVTDNPKAEKALELAYRLAGGMDLATYKQQEKMFAMIVELIK